MEEQVTTSDLYECAFYILNGGKLNAIEGIPVKNEITCRLTVKGDGVVGLQDEYFRGSVQVNLKEFRRVVNGLKSTVGDAKRNLRRQFSQQKRELKEYWASKQKAQDQGDRG